MKEKKIKGTNETFLNIANTLDKLTNITGKLGYAISKTRKQVVAELAPFEEQRELLIKKYGEENKETGQIGIYPSSDKFKDFIKQIQPLAEIELQIPFWQVTQEEFDNNESLFNSNANVNDFDILAELFIAKEEDKDKTEEQQVKEN